MVDDEENMRFLIRETLAAQNYEIETAGGGAQAMELIRNKDYGCVIMDVRMAGMDGLQTLAEIKKLRPDLPVIMMTAFGSRKIALQAIQEGAYDYFTKPFDINEMRVVVKRAMEKKTLERENEKLRRQLAVAGGDPRLVGRSQAMAEVLLFIDRVAGNDLTVLIQGPSGTGKELAATVIHEKSLRAHMPLIKMNCAAIPETLLESELFGHEKGAFTGAGARKIGKFEAAHGGTLFLDEIGDMSLVTQAKLLRVLEEHAFERVGGTETIRVDIRIIAATNQDLARAVAEKRFREDLFFRLNVLPVSMPPLYDRVEDIPLLVEHFLVEARERYGAGVRRMSSESMRLLMDYRWPGNVRELANVLQRAAVIAQGELITPDCLPAQIRGAVPQQEQDGKPYAPFDGSLQEVIDNMVQTTEKKLIQEALDSTDWSRTKTARMLKICRKSLHNKMKKYGLLEQDAEPESD